jgi:nitrite reductase/ring-hydroxylating ferredoxin subunit
VSVGYSGIQWNRQKKWYDATLVALILLAFGAWVAVSLVLRPRITAETLIIRGSAVAACVLLHAILCIGPLARLDRRFLPLLFNRRHLGVTMFLLAPVHAAFSVFQFHALAGVNPLVSIFTAYRVDYDPWVRQSANIAHFPFEPLGALALVILFVMAATSHDFWLRNLGPSMWKALHLMVFVAYGLLVGHVALGTLQSEPDPTYVVLLFAGMTTVFGLHVAAARHERRVDRVRAAARRDGFVPVCRVADLFENRGKPVRVGDERVALFLTGARVHAISNVCRHQGGPLGEGRIIDGCVTCPWHGWQYRPRDGVSPPPFDEKVETYRVRVMGAEVFVHPEAAPPGTPQEGAAV